MKEAILTKMGLTPTEAKIYLYLLKLGSTTAGPLIKKAELHRATVYDVLERLMEKGLVSFIRQEGKRYYQAADPEVFENLIKQKENEIKSQKELLEKTLPELKSIKKSSEQKMEVEVFIGRSGLRTVFEDIIRKGETTYGMVAQGNFQKYFPEYFEQWHKKMGRNKILYRVLYSENARALRKKNPIGYSEIRYVDPKYGSPTVSVFYADYVLILTWGEQPVIIRIRNKELYNNHRKFFDVLWNIGKS